MTPHPIDAWRPWTPEELSRRIDVTLGAWCVTGGWALDLWHGRRTRAHEDLDFAILRRDQFRFRAALSDLDFFTAHDGALEHLAPQDAPPPHVGQLWGADRNAACWRVDMMFDPGDDLIWAFKRDRKIRAPRSQMVRRGATGIPYLAPAAVLLFKAKHQRDKDEADFRLALPRLAPPERATLRRWLAAAHPRHDWLARL